MAKICIGDFDAQTIDGNKVLLAKYRGKAPLEIKTTR